MKLQSSEHRQGTNVGRTVPLGLHARSARVSEVFELYYWYLPTSVPRSRVSLANQEL